MWLLGTLEVYEFGVRGAGAMPGEQVADERQRRQGMTARGHRFDEAARLFEAHLLVNVPCRAIRRVYVEHNKVAVLQEMGGHRGGDRRSEAKAGVDGKSVVDGEGGK